jgi:hypothetical protein
MGSWFHKTGHFLANFSKKILCQKLILYTLHSQGDGERNNCQYVESVRVLFLAARMLLMSKRSAVTFE